MLQKVASSSWRARGMAPINDCVVLCLLRLHKSCMSRSSPRFTLVLAIVWSRERSLWFGRRQEALVGCGSWGNVRLTW